MICNKCGAELVYDNSFDIEGTDDYYSVFHCSNCNNEIIEIEGEE